MSEERSVTEPSGTTKGSETALGTGGEERSAQSAGRSLTVVIPILNEGRSIVALETRLTPALDGTGRSWNVLFVDDGSTDATLSVIRSLHDRDPRYGAISLSRNFGKEIAVAAGLRNATGDGVILMDGDLQHPPEIIGQFVEEWDKGTDVVYGRRRDRDADTGLHRWSSFAFYRVFRTLSGTELPDGAGDFRLIDRRVVDVLNRFGERARFNKGLFAWVGFKTVGVPFDVEERAEGQSRWRWRRLLSFAIDGLVSFTTIPLRVWSYLGLFVSAISIFYAVWFLLKTLVFGVDVPGFPTLVISVLLLSGVQLISLGVIGEYLGRVYEEVKGRPLFIVAERIGSDAAVDDLGSSSSVRALPPASVLPDRERP
jgi:glycosyltransferase involved in cell wall biosynthesis